jgi:hypothetical protein
MSFDLDALLAAINTPTLPGALCRNRSELFDPVSQTNPDHDHIEGVAIHLCHQCPALTDCARWLATLPPTQRPLGVVAGVVQHRAKREHKHHSGKSRLCRRCASGRSRP